MRAFFLAVAILSAASVLVLHAQERGVTASNFSSFRLPRVSLVSGAAAVLLNAMSAGTIAVEQR